MYFGKFVSITSSMVPPQTILTLDVDGKHLDFDIHHELKKVTKNRPFTKQFIAFLNGMLDGELFELNDEMRLLDFEDVVEEYLRNA